MDEIDPGAVEAPPPDGTIIVDVRSPASFERGHLPGSRNVPIDAIPDRVAAMADADRIVTVCAHGVASRQAARLIESYEDTSGEVLSLAGGLDAWDGPLTASETPD